jgi:hypothetical protein
VRNYKEEAETLRYGLLLGFTTVSDVVAWADAVLEASESPDTAIIDLAMAGHLTAPDVAVVLRDVPGECDPVMVMRILHGVMLRALDINNDRGSEIATRIYQLAAEGELSEAEFGIEPYALEDEFYFAEDLKIWPKAAAIESLRHYLVENAEEPAP